MGGWVDLDVSRYLLSLLFIELFFWGCENEKVSQYNSYNNYENACPPCSIIASDGMEVTQGKSDWPVIVEDELMKINSLTDVLYDNSIPSVWGVTSWWMQEGNDPWSNDSYWGTNYVPPEHDFDECVNDMLRWKCGYSYVVKVPINYDSDRSYPLVIFLHGGFEQSYHEIIWYHDILRNQMYMSTDDPYVYIAPIKLEVDWNAKKIQDVLEDVKNNLNIDNHRIYITGLSMGGRGTFIVAADLPDYFAGIMPLSPHHQPYSYLSLADEIAHLPIWMSHGNIDGISSYGLAFQMAYKLEEEGANIIFRTEEGVGHWGWENIYSDSAVMRWLLSWERR